MTRKKCRCNYCGLKYPVDNQIETDRKLKLKEYICPKCGKKTVKY